MGESIKVDLNQNQKAILLALIDEKRQVLSQQIAILRDIEVLREAIAPSSKLNKVD